MSFKRTSFFGTVVDQEEEDIDFESDNEEDDNKSESHYHDILAQSSNEYKYQRYLKRHLKKILIEKLYEENHSVWKDYIEDDVQFKKTRKIFNLWICQEKKVIKGSIMSGCVTIPVEIVTAA